MSRAGCIMVQGTMSGAGKSLLCAALCRIFAQDGYKTAPFKSQNMALNSFVTRDGLEMGRAQVVQAQAAGVEPDVRMNPILLKPSSDVGSQVIVNGEVRGDMPAKEYFRRKKSLIPDILRAYNSLADEFDIIVIEGAGSPAEINLKADDIVNMGLAKLVDAPVLLAGDIDRGGVFAQLYGTVALLEPDERARICGLIINKFRGDVEILRPGLAMLEEKTQLPVLGVVPYLRVEPVWHRMGPCAAGRARHAVLAERAAQADDALLHRHGMDRRAGTGAADGGDERRRAGLDACRRRGLYHRRRDVRPQMAPAKQRVLRLPRGVPCFRPAGQRLFLCDDVAMLRRLSVLEMKSAARKQLVSAPRCFADPSAGGREGIRKNGMLPRKDCPASSGLLKGASVLLQNKV